LPINRIDVRYIAGKSSAQLEVFARPAPIHERSRHFGGAVVEECRLASAALRISASYSEKQPPETGA
jgi:hypothetical protein